MLRNIGYLRLDTLAPVHPANPILWGPAVKASEVNRFMLVKERGNGRVPYVAISEKRAVRVVPIGGIEQRAAELAVLFAKHGPACLYCGCEVTEHTATVEHVVPLAADGPDNLWNKALSCADCNAAAGSKSAAEKLQYALARRLGVFVESLAEATALKVGEMLRKAR